MLKNLGIRNYALIDSADIEFTPGLTVITGETGSGKSIMLGALSLILGKRADSRVVSGEKARVEAYFEDVDKELHPLLENKGIDWIEEGGMASLTIRREISPSGKSRIYINDVPVTLATLSEIGPRLIDIHSQHANAKLADNIEQLQVLDVMSDCGEALKEYQDTFRRFASLKRQIDNLKKEQARNRENEQFLRFRFAQLDILKPRRGELTEIEHRYELLSDADEIKERLSELFSLVGDGEGGVLNLLSRAHSIMERLDLNLFSKENKGEDMAQRMEEITTEVKDISSIIEDMDQSIDTDPQTLTKLSERMDTYYQTMKQFSVTTGDELVDIYEKLKIQLSDLGGGNDTLHQLEKDAKILAAELKEKSNNLSRQRLSGANEFVSIINELGKELGLSNLRFDVRIEPTKLTSRGGDKVEFLCSFNKRGEMMPIGETASGGEMSRLMLCIKSVMATKMAMPTIIFDEVDTGVSGEIAERMGKMMKTMGESMQVIAITHLPQVASQGTFHFKVYKEDEGDRTVSHIERLGYESRIKEIAQMISGAKVTDSAMETARLLISE